MYLILYLSSVMVPMGGSTEVFTSQDEYEPEQFNYANVRKATYRGTRDNYDYSKYYNYQHYISIQVLCYLGNIPHLVCWCLDL